MVEPGEFAHISGVMNEILQYKVKSAYQTIEEIKFDRSQLNYTSQTAFNELVEKITRHTSDSNMKIFLGYLVQAYVCFKNFSYYQLQNGLTVQPTSTSSYIPIKILNFHTFYQYKGDLKHFEKFMDMAENQYLNILPETEDVPMEDAFQLDAQLGGGELPTDSDGLVQNMIKMGRDPDLKPQSIWFKETPPAPTTTPTEVKAGGNTQIARILNKYK